MTESVKKGTPKEVAIQEKHEKTKPPREVLATSSTAGVPNSAPLPKGPSTTGNSTLKRRNADKNTSTASTSSGTGKKKPPPKKQDTDISRLDKLEKTLETQAEQNKLFQHNILAALNALAGVNEDDDSSVTSEVSAGEILHAASASTSVDHPMSASDDEDEHVQKEHKSDPPGQNKKEHKSDSPGPSNKEAEAGTQPAEPELGFAAQFAMEVDEGSPIGDQIVTALGHVMTYKLDETKLKEAMDRHKCPSNCDALKVPMVNPQIWKDIPSKSKTRDLKLQRVQKPLIKGMIALSKLVGDKKLGQDGVDGFTLIANAAFELNCLRREMLKPDISPQFHSLCKPPVYDKKANRNFNREYYSLLFGNELGKNIEDLQKESKATSSMIKFTNRGSARYNPYPKKNHTHSARQSLSAAAAAAGWSAGNKPSFLGGKQFNRKQNFPKKNQQHTRQGPTQKSAANNSANQNKN